VQFAVVCKCGRIVKVTEGAAGARLPCSCGDTIAVPALNVLREQAGVPTLSPDFVLERLLLSGWEPDAQCASCGVAPAELRHYWVDCERAWVRRRGGLHLFTLFNFLTIPIIGISYVVWRRSSTEQYGRDKIYRLPLRLCETCQIAAFDEKNMKKALRAVSVYDQLLKMYPKAKVSSEGK
jgi:hypothetical protein